MSKVLQSLLTLAPRFQGAQARADEGRAGVQEELGSSVETKRVAPQTPELCAFKNGSCLGQVGLQGGRMQGARSGEPAYGDPEL